MDFERLKKILMLSTSSNENEALEAIKQANKMLKENGKTWLDFFSSETLGRKEEFDRLKAEYLVLASKYNNLMATIIVQQGISLNGVLRSQRSHKRYRRF